MMILTFCIISTAQSILSEARDGASGARIMKDERAMRIVVNELKGEDVYVLDVQETKAPTKDVDLVRSIAENKRPLSISPIQDPNCRIDESSASFASKPNSRR